MSRTIAQVKTTQQGRLHGTTLNKISDFYGICQEAAEMMLLRIDPQETIRRTLLTNAVYDNVFDYSLPTDFKAPEDLNKQANADRNDNGSLNRTYSREFINRKKDNQFAIVWRDGDKFLRFMRNINPPLVVDKADSLTENGTWTVGGNASNLTLDTINYIAGNGSLKCDVSSGGALVNVIIRIGSDSANYYTKTVTTGHFEAFKVGYNLLRFDFSSATEVGIVNMASIKYVRVTTTYNTNQTAYYEKTLTNGVDLSDNYDTDGAIFLYEYFDSITNLSLLRLDNIVASLGTLFDITYYSNYLFKNTSGTWIQKPTSDSDTVNLSELSYKIFDAEVSRIIAQQAQGAMGAFDYSYWNNLLEDPETGLYALYTLQYPSERIEGSTTYYNTESGEDPSVYPNVTDY